MTRCSAVSKNRFDAGCRGDECRVGRKLGDECQRKVASNLIDAWRDHADDGQRSARARGAGEAPRRAGEVDVEPAAAERRLARGETLAQPAIPRVHERVGDAPPQEVAVAGQLAVEAYLHERLTIRS